MRVFDTSSIIHAWDNYPIRQFPGLWQWMADQISEKEVALPTVAYAEVKQRSLECAQWLNEAGTTELPMTNEVFLEAFRIKALVGIEGDDYHRNGVGENDLFIVATARIHKAQLISEEGRQPEPPKNRRKFKIPAVCEMPDVRVVCLNFIEFLKGTDAVFG